MKSDLNFKAIHDNGELFDMHELGIWVASFHIHSPNAQRTKTSVSGSNGSMLSSSRMGERQVNIRLQVETDTIYKLDDLKHLIFSLFFTWNQFSIVRDITPERTIHVLQEGDYDIENITCADGVFDFSLSMLDPFIYGQTQTRRSNKINVNGTAKTAPFITAVIKEAAPYIQLSCRDKTLKLHYNFKKNDVVKIDFEKRKVFINGQLQMKTVDLLYADFFNLQPGKNIISTVPSMQLEVQYTERWL